ncbi:hypothetical protein [Sulfurimonas marina]|uniref:hypothetical protein n=1 Tax=Sulfurimonas marina TaxID=2590551 RepID=UPI001D0444E6|nr:hypothetical protein [Sulfurimonas marina]
MPIIHDKILLLLDYVKIDSASIVCHFKCKESNKEVISELAFEPYDGKIEITWKEMLLHPIESYNRYYHTPIVIYSHDTHETIVLKAFQKVANRFKWNSEKKQYVCND